MQAADPTPVHNIGREGVESRLCLTTYAFALTLGLVIGMRALGAPTWSYGFMFVPFTVSFLLAYQGMWKTCTGLASRGMRDVGDGHECIANPRELRALRARGRRIMAYVFASAAVATALVMAALSV